MTRQKKEEGKRRNTAHPLSSLASITHQISKDTLKRHFLLAKDEPAKRKGSGENARQDRPSDLSCPSLCNQWIRDGLAHSSGFLAKAESRAEIRVKQVYLEYKIYALSHSQFPFYPGFLSCLTLVPVLDGTLGGLLALSSITAEVWVNSFSLSLFRIRLEFFKENIS